MVSLSIGNFRKENIFVRWLVKDDTGNDTGECNDAKKKCKFTLNKNKTVTPIFQAKYSLNISLLGNKQGVVKSIASDIINCEPSCFKKFSQMKTRIQLIATTTPTSTFAGWSGACVGAGECNVIVDSAMEVGALFQERATTTLSVTLDRPNGAEGKVTSVPSGIDCPYTCLATFYNNQTITLTATPSPSSTFLRWGGDCS